MAFFKTSKFLFSNSMKDTWSETCFAMAKAEDLGLAAPRCARVALSSVVSLTSSTSYCARASSMLTGRPDQITSSGLMGGMKRIDLEDWIS